MNMTPEQRLTQREPLAQNVWTEADEVAAAAVGLPGARTLLDSSALSALLGRPTRVTRVRIKTGHSVVAALETDDGERSWAMLTVHADKLTKARQRASDFPEAGSFTVHSERGPYLFSGAMMGDPVLAKDLREARRALDSAVGQPAPWRVLRYNPRRRVVAAVPASSAGHGEKIIRVSPAGTAAALDAAQRWRSLGLPVVRSSALGKRGTAMSAPLWGWTDLSHAPHTPAAVTAGEAIGQLHQRTLGARRNLLAVELPRTVKAVASIAPWLAVETQGLRTQLQSRLPRMGMTPLVELHGDLSPDQIVMAAPESHKIRLIDFDRSGSGDPARDVGSWVASCRRLGCESLIDAFLSGYEEHFVLDQSRVAVWEAYAHLAAATEPFRLRSTDWPALMQRSIRLAQETLDR